MGSSHHHHHHSSGLVPRGSHMASMTGGQQMGRGSMSKGYKFTKEELVEAWKDPQVREKLKDLPNHPSGKALNELSEEELAEIQGASDVQPKTTPLCVGVIIGITASIKICK